MRFAPYRICFALLSLLVVTTLHAQDVTSPRSVLGFDIGDDYHLATYTQLDAYWRTLANESPRMALEEIGLTAEGRPQLMAVITSPENHAQLDRYRGIARRLALAEGVSDDEARALAAEGKAIIWIDGGLHATEVLGAHQLMELVYQMVSRSDAETLRFLDDIILLAVHANPDGMELVSEWYMREPDPSQRSTSNTPRLYQKYIGHDNNRDFYMISQPETENMARIMYREWFPQIIYNHHQTGPAGTIMFAPPFRDPFNYAYDPLIPVGLDAVGAAMHGRFVEEGKPGTTMRSGASYSTWWNGGLRTTAYFHNQIGLLTETIGNPTPIDVPLIPDRQLPRNDLPAPIAPQRWHFRQSIEYSMTANRAVLDHASRHREQLLYRIYRMGANSIERGSRDHWTVKPTHVEAMKEAILADGLSLPQGRRPSGVPAEYFDTLRAPPLRDPRAYVLSASQTDFPTATKFVNALIKGGVTVHRATEAFRVDMATYPAGSYVVKTAQAFRPHILDLFEPQDHPNDFEYPGGPPIAPYDNAGWTLAYLMGVDFDRVLEDLTGPFEPIEELATPLPGRIANAVGAVGFLLSHAYNDAALVTNRLTGAGHDVRWVTEPFRADGTEWPAGTIYIPNTDGARAIVSGVAGELGVSFTGVETTPAAASMRIHIPRIALWDEYGGSMPSGWTRWLLERFEFPFEIVFPQDLDTRDLASDFDAIVLVNGSYRLGSDRRNSDPDPLTIPTEFRDQLGRVTAEQTVPRLERFIEAGGTVITIGGASQMAGALGLPVESHLTDDNGESLSDEAYYMPGSIHRVQLDTTRPVAWGLPEDLDVFFNNSPVIALTSDPSDADMFPLARFEGASSLRSGWAWGEEHLEGGIAMAEGRIGDGVVYLFGPEILNRGQTHGTFKLFFNALQLASAERRERSASTSRR